MSEETFESFDDIIKYYQDIFMNAIDKEVRIALDNVIESDSEKVNVFCIKDNSERKEENDEKSDI